MVVLGIETATAYTGVAVGGDGTLRASLHLRHDHRHSETLAPAVELACRHAEVALRSITLIAVDIGPGLFSGVRVGVSTANALAHALKVPVLGVSSLDLLAFPARLSGRTIVAMLDALRGEVYWATYAGRGDDVEPLGTPVLARPAEVIERLRRRDDPCVVVGDGARNCPGLVEVPGVEVAGPDFDVPSAASLIHVATARSKAGRIDSDGVRDVLYLREPNITRPRATG